MKIWDFAMTYWTQLVVTGGTSAIVYIVKKGVQIAVEQAKKSIDEHFEEDMKEQAAIKYGVLSLAHYILYASCREWIALDYITLAGLEDLEHLYNAYHELGGNGTGTKLYEQCKQLPIKYI